MKDARLKFTKSKHVVMIGRCVGKAVAHRLPVRIRPTAGYLTKAVVAFPALMPVAVVARLIVEKLHAYARSLLD